MTQRVDKPTPLSFRTSDRCHWCGNPYLFRQEPAKSAGFVRFRNGLPRQSADWLAMTGFFDRLNHPPSAGRGMIQYIIHFLCAGIRTVKVLPCPGALSTSAVPPWSRAICRTMYSPSPVPSPPLRAGST